ncbi:MAG: hypothetical protein M0P01_13670 [Treponema sp.]|nr:hypothetical protein [Treponema sp.]
MNFISKKVLIFYYITFCCVLHLAAEHRVALVIGNAAYTDMPLKTIQEAVRRFTEKITSGDTVALFHSCGGFNTPTPWCV